jgi:hypothetical protein
MSIAKECDDVYLPLACPKCGTTGPIALSRLNRRFRCKSCRSQFYIDKTGNFSLGDPPRDPSAGASGGRMRMTAVYWIARFWELLPRWAKWSGLATALALLASVGVMLVLNQPATIPDSLLDRAAFVAEALARNEPAKIKLLASPDSAGDVSDWIDKARPRVWKDSPDETTVIHATAETMAEDKTSGTACVRATFIIPPGIFSDKSRTSGAARKARDKPGGEFNLILFWVLSDQGTWLLDVDRSLKAAPHADKD